MQQFSGSEILITDPDPEYGISGMSNADPDPALNYRRWKKVVHLCSLENHEECI